MNGRDKGIGIFLFPSMRSKLKGDVEVKEVKKKTPRMNNFLVKPPDTSACPQSILGSAQLNLSWPLRGWNC